MQKSKVNRVIVLVVVIIMLTVSFSAVSVMAYEAATDFRYPLNPGGWFLGQDFGVWNSFSGGYHLAEDLLPSDRKRELPVYAPANGQVRHSGFQSGYGYVVVIEHRLPDNTYVCSVLGHLKAANLVPRGTDVAKGQLIGYLSAHPVENGGYSFTHLHFGIRSGPYSTARDADGGWRYRGYAASTAIRALWQNPTNFVNDSSAPAPVPQPGSLQVSISPQGAIDAGAQWRLAGSATWRDSGYTAREIPVGSYTVEFKDVPGWDKPANQSVTIQNGRTATAAAVYVLQQSSPVLSVNLTSLNFGLVRQGTYASPRSYIVAGKNLTNNVRIQAPTCFWISTSSLSGYGRTVTLQPSNGVVYQRIYVSYLPTSVGSSSSTITHSAPGATTINVRVSGRGY